jgi:hypothetical protein
MTHQAGEFGSGQSVGNLEPVFLGKLDSHRHRPYIQSGRAVYALPLLQAERPAAAAP